MDTGGSSVAGTGSVKNMPVAALLSSSPCIIYWQAKEIHRVIQTHTLPDHINLDLLSNISPVSWGNIILYGDYIFSRNKVVL